MGLFIDCRNTKANTEKTQDKRKLLLHYYCPQQRGVVTLPQMFCPRDKKPLLQSDMRLHYLVQLTKSSVNTNQPNKNVTKSPPHP